MGFIATERIDVWVSVTPNDVPPLSPALYKTFWVNFADLKVYTAKFNDSYALELITLDLSVLAASGEPPKSTLLVDLPDSLGAQIKINGDGFDPPITKQPSTIDAIQISESGAGLVASIIDGFEPNADGIHWDILISAQPEEMPNVKITVS